MLLRSIESDMDFLASLRRDLHAHPELGFQENRTASKVAEILTEAGIEVVENIGKTGVVGIIKGKFGPGRTIGLRADMDALPIEEQSNLPWRSQTPGIFHGCGHDGHTTILIAAARYLQKNRDFSGQIVLIFQPAEEGLGGARAMLTDGLFERFPCDEIYALHNAPDREFGTITIGKGLVSASADFFDIDILGNGGHAAAPHTTIDAGIVAIAIAQNLQTIVSRNLDPLEAAVVSITAFSAGDTYNVIPGAAHLAGTIRTMKPETRAQIAERLRLVSQNTASAFGASAEVKIRDVFSALVNHEEQSEAVVATASKLLQADMINQNPRPVMTSEDFADMLLQVPGAYFFLGQGFGPALHNPAYAFNDEIIPLGAAMMAQTALDRLK